MRGFWMFVAVLVALVSVPLHSIALLLVGSMMLLLSVISRLWARYSLARVEYQHFLSSPSVFQGEEVQFTSKLTNGKFLPLPWIQVNDELPQQVSPLQGRAVPAPYPGRIALASYLSLGWYHRVTRTYTLRCEQRGYYYLGPVHIRSGDLFGMSSQEMDIERDLYLTVYPRVLPLVASRPPSREPYGSVRVQRLLVDDVTRPVGSRDYMPGDSLRYVHWKSTARTGRLQTRVFDASTTANLVLFLGVRTMEPPLQGTIPHLLELSVLTTTALANYAMEQGQPVGVYVNQTSSVTSQLLHVPPARHPDQLTKILEVMAQVHSEQSVPLASLIQERSRSLPWGTTLLVVAAVPDEATLTTLGRLRRAGWAVGLVHIGGADASPNASGIPRYIVPGGEAWRTLKEIVLQ